MSPVLTLLVTHALTLSNVNILTLPTLPPPLEPLPPAPPAIVLTIDPLPVPPPPPPPPPAPTVQTTPLAENDYAWGNCTWYVAGRRSVPNNWGNADTWWPSAIAAGYAVGHAPRVGAIAQTAGDSSLGHVAIVEAVYPGGSFQISEMNATAGLGAVDYRTTTTSEFPNFIY